MQATSLMLLPGALSGPIPSDYAGPLTIYHVNPLSEGIMPFDMDSGDAPGDMMFDFRSKVLPFECHANPSSHDCTNPEVVGEKLVISKLELEVDTRFGQYARCNMCINGTDGHGDDHCTDGQYVCSCSVDETVHKDCPLDVGMVDLLDTHSGKCEEWDAEWKCWHEHVVAKTKGKWISTVKDGYCGDGSSTAPDGCTWRVMPGTTPKAIEKECSDNVIYDVIENYDDNAKHCFGSCDDSGPGHLRNESSFCWVRCFFKTFLGEDGGAATWTSGGIPMEQVTKAWEDAFDVCPSAGPSPTPTPGPTPSPSPSPTGDWFSYNALNCYSGHGAKEIDTTPLQATNVEECRAQCDKMSECDGITYQYAEGSLKCWRRKQFDLGNCQGGNYVTDVKKAVLTQLRVGSACLDLPGGNTDNGNSLWMWECNSFDNQLWHLSAEQLLYAAVPTKCLDVPGNDMTDGTIPEIWECNGLPQQQVSMLSGLLGLVKSDDKCLKQGQAQGSQSFNVEIADCDTSDSGQKWSIHYGPGEAAQNSIVI